MLLQYFWFFLAGKHKNLEFKTDDVLCTNLPFQNQPKRELTDVLYISLLLLTLPQIHLAFLPMTDTREDERLWWLTGFTAYCPLIPGLAP